MQKKTALFREEALQNRLHRSLGTIRINVPFHYRIAATGALILLIAVFSFIGFAETAEKIYIRGYLDTKDGVVMLHADQGGVILKGPLEEGEKVKKGETLFLITHTDQEKTKDQIARLTQRIRNLKREYQLKKEHYDALSKLYTKKYIAASRLKDTETELLEINNRIQTRKLEMMQYQQSQYQRIQSPVDGTITNIFYHTGQSVTAAKPLLQIIPASSCLIARLYLPARDIGFLKKGDPVVLQYDAYPSRRFGFYNARIQEINRSVLTDDKEDKPVKIGEPYYKIKAELAQDYVNFYGKKAGLTHGMTLTAVISGEKKKLWQWVFDPLYSYYGEVFS